MHQTWKFIHILGAFFFVLSHGASVTVSLRLRKERDRDRILSLLQLSGSTIIAMYVWLAVLVFGGIMTARAIKTPLTTKWILWSLIVLGATILAMGGLARPYYQGIKEAVALRPSGAPRVSDDDLDKRLRSPRAHAVATVGFLGLIAILWLMVFKPV